MNPAQAKSQARHLIIAGVTRAGTTSLYNYLGDHPDVRASTIKETRFFMDTDELRRMYRYEEGPDHYEKYFPDCPHGALRLEATPDYMYRPAAAQRIAETLPDAHIIIILREPVSRLISWRRYAIQNGLLDPDTSLTDYIQAQFDALEGDQSLPQHLRALQEGCYSNYLSAWINTFDRDRLTILHYNDLLTDPAGIARRVCGQIGIDPGFYDGYDFKVHNESRPVRWPRVQAAYRSLIWRVKPYVHNKPVTRAALRKLRRTTDTALGRTGTTTHSPAETGNGDLTPNDRAHLQSYYQQEPTNLARLLNLPDWQW